MAASGARAQKPVGSAAWVSTEKENIVQLVDQEMEEIEYPVRHEMDWLNEHMAEVFSNNQFNLADVFKTPGKMRGKTPRTIRKRNVEDNRVPLSEIFSSSHNQTEHRSTASPAVHRSPAKAAAAAASPANVSVTQTTNAKNRTAIESRPQYPDLTQNVNSFPQYNTDSGYHGMQDDEDDGEDEDDNNDDDDVVLTQTQPDSQPSTQPLESEPVLPSPQVNRFSVEGRTTDASFHSAHENIRATVEPESMSIDTTPTQVKVQQPLKPALKQTKQEKKPEPQPVPEVESDSEPESELEPEPKKEVDREIEPTPEREMETGQDPEPEPVAEPRSSPVKTPAFQPSETQQEMDAEREDMALDTLDDMGSPSDASPERPLIRKSSLSFASLPAREPLMKKSLGGSRLSRTSHVDIPKLNNAGGYLGRQTAGQKTPQAASDDSAAPDDDDHMDIDDHKATSHENPDADSRASKLHNKSSTQRLHEKISMLGKFQPSRPTKSIPSAAGLSANQVAYPELPATKAETKQETTTQASRETPAPETMETEETEEDWIKPLSSPERPILPKSQTADAVEKLYPDINPAPEKDDAPVARKQHVSDQATRANAAGSGRPKSATPAFSSPQRVVNHQKSASVSHFAAGASTTPVGSPERSDGPLSASKSKLQSIMRSAKGLFTSTGGVSASARMQASSPDELQFQSDDHTNGKTSRSKHEPKSSIKSPPKQEGRRTRSSTEKEEKRKQKEIEDRQQEEEQAERTREQERQKALQLKAAQEKAAQEKAWAEQEARAAAAPSPKKIPQPQKQSSKEPEPSHESGSKATAAPASQLPKQNERRPVKPTRETVQKPKPQPVSIRVGSALSRQIPLASNATASIAQESNIPPAPTPASASRPSTLKKKASNSSLHTASSNGSMKSTVSAQSQRKAQLANERKKEQEEREARRREEQKRELERKRAAQEDTRRQEARSRAGERAAPEDPRKAAQMQAIEKRRQENARRLERQGSQQPSERGSILHQDKPSQQVRPASRLGSIQPTQSFNRSINPPQPNPAKPAKRGMEDEASHRPAPSKPSTAQPAGDSKRRRTEDEHNPAPSVRPTMAPPIRQSNIRKPSVFGHGQPSMPHQSGSSIFKSAQPQRPAHPMDMAKYASGKIPFAEPNPAQPPTHKTPGASSSQKGPVKASPQYPNGENINLPEIATDSEDEDSDAEMLPVPKWAQPKELENLLRAQEGMEVDSIFGPIAPFSLEDTFKADKKIKKFRDRTSSANWSGADGLTQDEIRKDIAERQRLRMNGGWTFGT